jgi:NhaP-type Na+/H+ or K+/H+ antiporter
VRLVEGLVVFAVVLVLYALVSRRLDGTPLTAPMVFVLAGAAATAAGADLIPFGEAESGDLAETPRHVAELALVLLLFTDAARIDTGALRRGSSLPLRLLGIGCPLTIALGGLVALGLFSGELEFWEAFLVAAILAPTDAALGAAVVSNPKLPLELRQVLNVEAGLNDGLAVPFFTVFAALAADSALDETRFLNVALEKLGYGLVAGVAIGAAGGYLLRRSAAAGWIAGAFQQLALAALALLAWWSAEEIGGSGLIAAFTVGLALAVVAREVAVDGIELSEEVGELLALLVFFALGTVAVDALETATWESFVFAALALTVLRMLPVAVAVRGIGLDRPTVAYVGWFGPRGLASMLLVLILVIDEPDLPGEPAIFVTVLVTVLFSVFAHGLTAAPLTDRLARREQGG